MGKKILLPYLSAGLGHMILAQAIADSVHALRPDWELRLMDAAVELDDKLLQRTFVDLWKTFLKMPPFLSTAAFALERLAPGVARALNRRSFRTSVPKAASFLEEYKPDLVMSTHWACSHLFAMARGERRIPLYYIYGELGETYSVVACGADHYFTLTDRTEDGLARFGVDRARMQRIPLVVDQHMIRSGVPRDVLRRALGVPAENLVVVLSLGGEGLGGTMPFIQEFARTVTGASLVVLTGRNAELLREVKEKAGSAVIALGYQEDISGVIGAADVLAGKSGTGYAMMAMAMGVPLIVTHLGAPNERGNMRHIVENGFGWYCPRPGLFTGRVSTIVKERGTCRDSSNGHRPPEAGNGADVIARAIVDALS
jgi:UDP-N-acetylglucosamine:LPS N-acetylglucosamine transferase